MVDSSASKPLTPEEKRAHRQAIAKAKRQFALLGLFVQSFEDIVATLRHQCVQRTQGFQRGVTVENSKLGVHVHIAEIIFSHQVMSAKPILDLWRAITHMTLHTIEGLSDKEKAIYSSVMGQIASDFTNLIERRNAIIHATWFIGGLPDPEFPLSQKNSVTKSGLGNTSKLPTSEAELETCISDCKKIYGYILLLNHTLQARPNEIYKVFVKDVNGRWIAAKQPSSSLHISE